jgi:hypothetical protein
VDSPVKAPPRKIKRVIESDDEDAPSSSAAPKKNGASGELDV